MYSMTMYSQNMLWEQENILRESRAFEDDGMYTVHTSDTYSFVLLGKTTWGIVAATWGKDCCVPVTSLSYSTYGSTACIQRACATCVIHVFNN